MKRFVSFALIVASLTLVSLALTGQIVTHGRAEAAANPAYLECLQRAKAYCQASTAHVKPPHRAKAYQQCYAAARARCGPYNQPNRLRSTPLR